MLKILVNKENIMDLFQTGLSVAKAVKNVAQSITSSQPGTSLLDRLSAAVLPPPIPNVPQGSAQPADTMQALGALSMVTKGVAWLTSIATGQTELNEQTAHRAASDMLEEVKPKS